MINNEKSNFKKQGGIDNPVVIHILQSAFFYFTTIFQTYAHGKIQQNLQTSIQHEL